jgi:hypothetical protein
MMLRSLVCASAVVVGGCVPSVRPPLLNQVSPSGFRRPVIVQNASPNWRWVAACFAMADSNHDGEISVTVARHGNTFGDELTPYLLLDRQRPLAIDEYVAASPDHRFIAVALGGALQVVDAATSKWLKLPEAEQVTDASPVLPHPAISFASNGRAAFRNRREGRSRIILVDLLSGAQTSVFETDAEVARFELSDTTLRVDTISTGTVDDSIRTNLAPRRCRGQAASYSVFRATPDPTTPVDVPLPQAASAAAPREEVLARYHECTTDGAPVLASSGDGREHLAAAAFQTPSTVELGPLRWTRGELHRNNCPWAYR